MQSPRLAKSNSKFAALGDVVATVHAPVVDFTFVDDSKVSKATREWLLRGSLLSWHYFHLFVSVLCVHLAVKQKTFHILTPKHYAKDIINEMWEHAKEIDFEYQINDKEIDV
jgi:hypothetical protein